MHRRRRFLLPVLALVVVLAALSTALRPERLGELSSDILVSYADTEDQSAAFLDSDRGRLMSQVRDGRVAQVVGTEFIAAVSPTTALSLTWGLEEYVAALSEAAETVDAAGGAAG